MKLDLRSPILKRYKVEVEDNASGFRFRLVKKDGRKSKWGNYSSVVMLDQVAAVTAYYGGSENELKPMFAIEVLSLIALGEDDAT
jgi:hypothetical protein